MAADQELVNKYAGIVARLKEVDANYFKGQDKTVLLKDKCFFMRDRNYSKKYLGPFIQQKPHINAYGKTSYSGEELVFKYSTLNLSRGDYYPTRVYELPECLSKEDGEAALPYLIKALDAPPLKTKEQIIAEIKIHEAKIEVLKQELARMSGGSRNKLLMKKVRRTKKLRS